MHGIAQKQQTVDSMTMGTESFDSRYKALDTRDSGDVMSLVIEAQQRGLDAVRAQIGPIAAASDAAASRLAAASSGRIVYAGAGTSIRLGVQDGVELTPTFGWPGERLAFAIAGGEAALTQAIEGAEDDEKAAETMISTLLVGPDDICIAISASGATPYTCAACAAARKHGALTIGIANNTATPLLTMADHPISIDSGAEPVAGSTRMTAGTTQKIVLNMLSTAIMIRLGRVYDGLMVDVIATNEKLVLRARAMVGKIAHVNETEARQALDAADGHVKLAVLIANGLAREQAQALLDRCAGNLRAALAEVKS